MYHLFKSIYLHATSKEGTITTLFVLSFLPYHFPNSNPPN